jgi:hypothetical protein
MATSMLDASARDLQAMEQRRREAGDLGIAPSAAKLRMEHSG